MNCRVKNNLITVANLSDWRKIDSLWKASDSVDKHESCIFDMINISYLNPQAIIMLFLLCKKIKEKTNYPVFLDSLSPQVYGYLRRIDFFKYDFAYAADEQYIDYGKNPQSTNLIELTKVNSLLQINKLGDWFYSSFEHWFPEKSQSMYRQLSFEAINELISNSVEHSSFDCNGEGYFLLQRYVDSEGNVNVLMSVGDYGMGIRTHLIRKYPELSSLAELEILLQAISGKSGRIRDAGGRGLKSICALTKEYGGYFFIRSNYGLIFIQNGNISAEILSYPIPGTQCAFCLRTTPHPR
jgi:hypothetical protein